MSPDGVATIVDATLRSPDSENACALVVRGRPSVLRLNDPLASIGWVTREGLDPLRSYVEIVAGRGVCTTAELVGHEWRVTCAVDGVDSDSAGHVTTLDMGPRPSQTRRIAVTLRDKHDA
jgi:hypothetical protein